MDNQTHDIVETYRKSACNPSVASAILWLSPDEDFIRIFSTWSISDLVKSESTKYVREFLLQCPSGVVELKSSGLPCDASSVSLCAYASSKYAVLRKSKKNDESSFLEIWSLTQLKQTFDMSDRKEHGKIHDGGSFQLFEWSSNQRYLLYIAEAKQKKTESYFKDLFCYKEGEKDGEEEAKGEENVYRESWGESNTNAHHTVLCIFDTETGNVDVVDMDGEYPNMSIAQAAWGPNDEHIVFAGYNEAPFRLGLIYCSNRRSSIFSYNVKTKSIERLTLEENISVECPVFSPNFEMFVFLQVKAGGPHKSCNKLMKCDWKTKKISTLVDIVEEPKGEEFAGLYISKLSSRWWSANSQHFFFHNFRRSFLEIFYVDVISKEVKKIKTGEAFGTCTLHDVKDPYILASFSSPNRLPQLAVGLMEVAAASGIQVKWSILEESSDKELTDFRWKVHTLSPSLSNEIYPNLDYDVVVISPIVNNGTLIIFPHGGPHSVFLADYSAYDAALARLGYIICKVNYRGSIGFGENSIRSLLGSIGTQDVSDVINAIEYLRKDTSLGIKQIMGFGGSHGGFLITHLLGQYPDLLKAAVVRNPVVDQTSKVGVSDIPDWAWIETGCSEVYNPSDLLTPSDLKTMWDTSPIKYVKQVKSPTLLCLGKVDLRVPPSQGLLFHKYLKVQNVPTKVLFYDDNHALSKVAVSADAFVQIASWFQKYLS